MLNQTSRSSNTLASKGFVHSTVTGTLKSLKSAAYECLHAIPRANWKELDKAGAQFKKACSQFKPENYSHKQCAVVLYELVANCFADREKALSSIDAGIKLESSPMMQYLEDSSLATVLVGTRHSAYGVFLLHAKPETMLDWESAKAWAKSVGADLPTVQELSHASESLPDSFVGSPYWSKEYPPSGEVAWSKSLASEHGELIFKQEKCLAVAVRRICI